MKLHHHICNNYAIIDFCGVFFLFLHMQTQPYRVCRKIVLQKTASLRLLYLINN